VERLYVRLSDADLTKLVRRARAQRRHPGDEAGLILAKALREADEPGPVTGDPESGRVAVVA